MNFSELEQLSGAFNASRVLHTAVQLDIFSAIGQGATAEQVAQARQLNPRATRLLLDAMTGLTLLEKRDDRFFLTEDSRRYLLPESPRYFGGMIALEASDWEAWGQLDQAIKSGKPVWQPGSWANDADDTRRFIMAMDSLVRARGDADHVATLLDFTDVTRLLDVGAGPGTYPIAACSAHPHLSATIFDLPATLRVTAEVLAERNMTERINLVAGDFNEDPLPTGYDMVFLSNIIHSEDEPHCEALMKKCFEALRPGGRIVIKDHVLTDDRTLPVDGAVFSLQMLLFTRGRDYSLAEIGAWLTAAGFGPAREIPLSAPFSSSLVVAEKP